MIDEEDKQQPLREVTHFRRMQDLGNLAAHAFTAEEWDAAVEIVNLPLATDRAQMALRGLARLRNTM